MPFVKINVDREIAKRLSKGKVLRAYYKRELRKYDQRKSKNAKTMKEG